MNRGGFSWKRFIGITKAKQNFARKTGIPTTRSGLERKIGGMIMGKGCLVVFIGFILLLKIIF